MAYSVKKPLNMLENPVLPDIRQGPPQFKWAGRHWKVGSEIWRATETLPQFWEYMVLQQSRDYPKTRYGQSSHRIIVNSEFRPPILDPVYDTFPLSRLPRKPTIPRINPSFISEGSGTSGYTTPVLRINGLEKYYNDRKGVGNLLPIPPRTGDLYESTPVPDVGETVSDISTSVENFAFEEPLHESSYTDVSTLDDDDVSTDVSTLVSSYRFRSQPSSTSQSRLVAKYSSVKGSGGMMPLRNK